MKSIQYWWYVFLLMSGLSVCVAEVICVRDDCHSIVRFWWATKDQLEWWRLQGSEYLGPVYFPYKIDNYFVKVNQISQWRMVEGHKPQSQPQQPNPALRGSGTDAQALGPFHCNECYSMEQQKAPPPPKAPKPQAPPCVWLNYPTIPSSPSRSQGQGRGNSKVPG